MSGQETRQSLDVNVTHLEPLTSAASGTVGETGLPDCSCRFSDQICISLQTCVLLTEVLQEREHK